MAGTKRILVTGATGKVGEVFLMRLFDDPSFSDFKAGAQGIDALDQVDVHHPVVVDPQGVKDGILRNLETAIQISLERGFEIEV